MTRKRPWAPTAPIPISEKQALALASVPDDTRRLMDKLDAEELLADFFRLAWHILDPATPLVWGWVMDAISEHLEAVTSGQIQRLLINCPPGLSKTSWSCIFWPAWEWGPRNMPHLRYIKAAYAESLSIDANRKMRNLVQSDWYQSLWGDRVQITDDQDSKKEFGTKATGWSLATGVGGQLIGRRGNRFIIDDPHNTLQAESDLERKEACKWYFEGTSTRQNDPANPVEIIIMQRLHSEDVCGEILAKANYYGFEHLCIEMEFEDDHPVARKRRSRIGWRDPRCDLPDGERDGALCFPERYTPESVVDLKDKFDRGEDAGGNKIAVSYAAAGQLQQWPVPRKGGMFRVGKIRIKEWHELVELGLPANFHPRMLAGRMVRGWDFAGSERDDSPYTVGTQMFQLGRWVVVSDVVRFRVDASLIDARVGQVADADDALYGSVLQDVPQDPAQAGKAQVRALSANALAGHNFRYSPEGAAKELRALPFASQVNAGDPDNDDEPGNVVLVKGAWNKDYLAEFRMGFAGKFKDQIDASSRAYARLIQVRPADSLHGGVVIDLAEQGDGSWASSGAGVWGSS